MSSKPMSPAQNNNYYVVVSGFRDLSMPCQATNIAALEASPTFLPVRGTQNGVPQPSDSVGFSEVSLEFIHDEKMQSYFKILEWFNSVHLNNTNIKENDFYSTIELTVKDKQYNNVLRVLYYNCIPSSVSGIDMSIKDDNTYITNTVGVMYSHYTVVNLETGEEIDFKQ